MLPSHERRRTAGGCRAGQAVGGKASIPARIENRPACGSARAQMDVLGASLSAMRVIADEGRGLHDTHGPGAVGRGAARSVAQCPEARLRAGVCVRRARRGVTQA